MPPNSSNNVVEVTKELTEEQSPTKTPKSKSGKKSIDNKFHDMTPHFKHRKSGLDRGEFSPKESTIPSDYIGNNEIVHNDLKLDLQLSFNIKGG